MEEYLIIALDNNLIDLQNTKYEVNGMLSPIKENE